MIAALSAFACGASSSSSSSKAESQEAVESQSVDVQPDKASESAPDRPEGGAEPLPEVDAARIAYGTARYRTTFTIEGQETEVRTRRWLERDTEGGEAIVRVREVTESTQGDAEDVIDLAADSLRPLRKRAGQAPAFVEMDYGDRLVTGQITLGENEIPVRLELDAPAFGDGAALETAILALPLAEGYQTSLRSVDVGLQQRVRPWSLVVEASETVEVPLGSFETLRVKLEPLDEVGGEKTLWVRQEMPHLLVQVENRLPSELGGTVTTTVLVRAESAERSTP